MTTASEIALSVGQQEQLQNALFDAYPEKRDLAMMVRHNLGVNLSELTSDDRSYKVQIDDIIVQLASRGKTKELIKAAFGDRRGNPKLRKFVDDNCPEIVQELESDPTGGDRVEPVPDPRKDPPPRPRLLYVLAIALILIVIVLGIGSIQGLLPTIVSTEQPTVTSPNTSRTLWEKNWQQINTRFQGVYCCPDGNKVTNREKYIRSLSGLDLTSDIEIQNDFDRLVALIENAEASPDSY